MPNQKTLNKSVSCSGQGLHFGKPVSLAIHPAPDDHGIVFTRTDQARSVPIPARIENLRSSMKATTLGVNGTSVSTVEHLLAALSGMGVDNALIELSGPEVPILDGSARPFVEMIEAAGLSEQGRSRKFLVITRPITARINGSKIEARPSPDPSIFCSIAYNHPLLSYQEKQFGPTADNFAEEIAPARTFGFANDVEKLRALGLARGGSLDNAVVFDDHGVVNCEGMRWEDECVRHKILDIIGDLALLGMPVVGEISAHKSGHSLHHLLVQELISHPECVQVREEDRPHQRLEPAPAIAVAS